MEDVLDLYNAGSVHADNIFRFIRELSYCSFNLRDNVLYAIRAEVMENFEPFLGNERSAMVRGFFDRLITQLERSMFEYWL